MIMSQIDRLFDWSVNCYLIDWLMAFCLLRGKDDGGETMDGVAYGNELPVIFNLIELLNVNNNQRTKYISSKPTNLWKGDCKKVGLKKIIY